MAVFVDVVVIVGDGGGCGGGVKCRHSITQKSEKTCSTCKSVLRGKDAKPGCEWADVESPAKLFFFQLKKQRRRKTKTAHAGGCKYSRGFGSKTEHGELVLFEAHVSDGSIKAEGGGGETTPFRYAVESGVQRWSCCVRYSDGCSCGTTAVANNPVGKSVCSFET